MHHQCKCSVNGVVFRSFSWYKGQSPLWKGVPSCTRPRRRRRARGVCAHAQQQPKARAFSTPTQCRLALAAVVLHDVGSRLAEGCQRPRAAPTAGHARHPRPAARGHARPKTNRSAGRHYQSRPKEGRARDRRRLLSKNWPCKAGTYNEQPYALHWRLYEGCYYYICTTRWL